MTSKTTMAVRFKRVLWEAPTRRPATIYLCLLNLAVVPLGISGGIWALNLCMGAAFGLLAIADYRASAAMVGWVRLSALLVALLAGIDPILRLISTLTPSN